MSPKSILPVLGYVACGPGEEEEEQFIEYIHMPESLIGRGDFYPGFAIKNRLSRKSRSIPVYLKKNCRLFAPIMLKFGRHLKLLKY